MDERPEHFPWRGLCFPVKLQTFPPINGYEKRILNKVTSMAVMEVTFESSKLHNGRRNNYLRQTLYKGFSTEG